MAAGSTPPLKRWLRCAGCRSAGWLIPIPRDQSIEITDWVSSYLEGQGAYVNGRVYCNEQCYEAHLVALALVLTDPAGWQPLDWGKV